MIWMEKVRNLVFETYCINCKTKLRFTKDEVKSKTVIDPAITEKSIWGKEKIIKMAQEYVCHYITCPYCGKETYFTFDIGSPAIRHCSLAIPIEEDKEWVQVIAHESTDDTRN